MSPLLSHPGAVGCRYCLSCITKKSRYEKVMTSKYRTDLSVSRTYRRRSHPRGTSMLMQWLMIGSAVRVVTNSCLIPHCVGISLSREDGETTTWGSLHSDPGKKGISRFHGLHIVVATCVRPTRRGVVCMWKCRRIAAQRTVHSFYVLQLCIRASPTYSCRPCKWRYLKAWG